MWSRDHHLRYEAVSRADDEEWGRAFVEELLAIILSEYSDADTRREAARAVKGIINRDNPGSYRCAPLDPAYEPLMKDLVDLAENPRGPDPDAAGYWALRELRGTWDHSARADPQPEEPPFHVRSCMPPPSCEARWYEAK